jgi:hypothetical protein
MTFGTSFDLTCKFSLHTILTLLLIKLDFRGLHQRCKVVNHRRVYSCSLHGSALHARRVQTHLGTPHRCTAFSNWRFQCHTFPLRSWLIVTILANMTAYLPHLISSPKCILTVFMRCLDTAEAADMLLVVGTIHHHKFRGRNSLTQVHSRRCSYSSIIFAPFFIINSFLLRLLTGYSFPIRSLREY